MPQLSLLRETAEDLSVKLSACFVDAVTCEYITGFSNLLYDTQRGSYGDAEGILSFNTEKNADGSYSLVDRERNIFVYDAEDRTVTRTVADDAGVIGVYGIGVNLDRAAQALPKSERGCAGI